jgi:hypothetical protein
MIFENIAEFIGCSNNWCLLAEMSLLTYIAIIFNYYSILMAPFPSTKIWNLFKEDKVSKSAQLLLS